MSIGNTLRLLTKATGLSVTDLATAIPRAGIIPIATIFFARRKAMSVSVWGRIAVSAWKSRSRKCLLPSTV